MNFYKTSFSRELSMGERWILTYIFDLMLYMCHLHITYVYHLLCTFQFTMADNRFVFLLGCKTEFKQMNKTNKFDWCLIVNSHGCERTIPNSFNWFCPVFLLPIIKVPSKFKPFKQYIAKRNIHSSTHNKYKY